MLYFCFIILSSFFINIIFALVLLIQIMIGILYSWGTRFKTNIITSLISFSLFLAILPFIAGWVISKPLVSISPIVFIILTYFLVYGSLRNLPDERGDKQVGIKTNFYAREEMPLRIPFILSTPYLLILVLTLVGILEIKFLAIFVVLPLSVILILALQKAHSIEEKNFIRTIEQFHRWIFLIILLLIYYPTFEALLAAIILSTIRFLIINIIDIRFVRINSTYLKKLLIRKKYENTVTEKG